MCRGVTLTVSRLFWKARGCIDGGVFGGVFQHPVDFVHLEPRVPPESEQSGGESRETQVHEDRAAVLLRPV